MPYPAAQAAASSAPAQTTDAAPVPAAPPSQDIRVGPDGRIYGIDGMLDQIAQALMRNARTEILPAIQQDPRLQATVGAAVGRQLAKPLWVMAGVAAVWAGYAIYRSERSSRRTTRR